MSMRSKVNSHAKDDYKQQGGCVMEMKDYITKLVIKVCYPLSKLNDFEYCYKTNLKSVLSS